MSNNDLILFCLQICLMLFTAILFKKITNQLCLPSFVGEIIGGIVLGPTILGVFLSDYYNYLYSPDSVGSIGRNIVVNLGQLFFLFTVGLEVNLNYFKQQVRDILFISLLGIVIPFSLGAGSVIFLPEVWHIQDGNKSILALFIGIALSISALPVIARILMDVELLKTKLGTIILSAAMINDLCGWIFFSVILSTFDSGPFTSSNASIVIGLIIILIVLMYITLNLAQNKVSRLKSFLTISNDHIGIIVVGFLLAASITEAIGMHATFGAFIIGVILSTKVTGSNLSLKIINKFTNSFFVPIYFVSIGLKADFFKNFDLPLVLLIILVACAGKFSGGFIGAVINKMSLKEALIIGFAMNARGAMEMILASIAVEYGLIDQKIFVALIVMAIFTTLVSGVAIQKLVPEKYSNFIPQPPKLLSQTRYH